MKCECLLLKDFCCKLEKSSQVKVANIHKKKLKHSKLQKQVEIVRWWKERERKNELAEKQEKVTSCKTVKTAKINWTAEKEETRINKQKRYVFRIKQYKAQIKGIKLK